MTVQSGRIDGFSVGISRSSTENRFPRVIWTIDLGFWRFVLGHGHPQNLSFGPPPRPAEATVFFSSPKALTEEDRKVIEAYGKELYGLTHD